MVWEYFPRTEKMGWKYSRVGHKIPDVKIGTFPVDSRNLPGRYKSGTILIGSGDVDSDWQCAFRFSGEGR